MLYAFLFPTTVPSIRRRSESSNGANTAAISRGILFVNIVTGREDTVQLEYCRHCRHESRFCHMHSMVHESTKDFHPTSQSLYNTVSPQFWPLQISPPPQEGVQTHIPQRHDIHVIGLWGGGSFFFFEVVIFSFIV